MIVQKYNLNEIPEGVKPIVRVSQYDDLSREIVFLCPDATGIVIDDQEQEVTIDGNEISFVVGLELTQESGTKKGEVKIENTGSLNFYFEVENTPLAMSSEEILYTMNNRPSRPEISITEPIFKPIGDLKPSLDIADGLLSGELINAEKVSDDTDDAEYDDELLNNIESLEEIEKKFLEEEETEEESEVENATTDE